MTPTDLTALSTEAAAAATAVGDAAPAGAPVSLTPLEPGTVSSRLTGRPIGSGLAVSQGPDTVPPPAVSGADASYLPFASAFPYQGLDSFPSRANDGQTLIQAADFNRIIGAVRALQVYTEHVLRAAPIDLAHRLTAGLRTLATS